ncbi:MAG: hypothetical protein ABJF23_07280 [Bryobacteraceae bacterium]
MTNDFGPNDGGIHRGEGFETGDNEARRPDGVGPDGSGVRAGDDGPGGMPTADPSSEAEVLESTANRGVEMEGLSIVDADDPNLGLTGIDGVPPEDWAADTGPTRNPAAARGLSTKRMADRSSTLSNKG